MQRIHVDEKCERCRLASLGLCKLCKKNNTLSPPPLFLTANALGPKVCDKHRK